MTRGKRAKQERRARLAKEEAARRSVEAKADEFARRVLTPLAPGDPRIHHYVPRFLLRRFADEHGRIATVSLSDSARARVSSVEKTAAIRDFYSTIADGVGPNVSVEKLLAEIDGSASAVVEKLTSRGPSSLTSSDRDALAHFLALQKVRGPGYRRDFEALTDWTIKAHLTMDENRTAHEGMLEQEFMRYDDVEFVEHQNEAIRTMLEMADPLAESLRKRLITVVDFGQPGVVLTDEPLVLFQRPDPSRHAAGIGVATADEIWLPLDRSKALILHFDTTVGERTLRFDGEPAVVRDFNQTVVGCAFNEIYAHPDDVAGVRSLVLPDGDRPLITVSGSTDWIRGDTDGVNKAAKRRRPRRFNRDTTSPPG